MHVETVKLLKKTPAGEYKYNPYPPHLAGGSVVYHSGGSVVYH